MVGLCPLLSLSVEILARPRRRALVVQTEVLYTETIGLPSERHEGRTRRISARPDAVHRRRTRGTAASELAEPFSSTRRTPAASWGRRGRQAPSTYDVARRPSPPHRAADDRRPAVVRRAYAARMLSCSASSSIWTTEIVEMLECMARIRVLLTEEGPVMSNNIDHFPPLIRALPAFEGASTHPACLRALRRALRDLPGGTTHRLTAMTRTTLE